MLEYLNFLVLLLGLNTFIITVGLVKQKCSASFNIRLIISLLLLLMQSFLYYQVPSFIKISFFSLFQKLILHIMQLSLTQYRFLHSLQIRDQFMLLFPFYRAFL
mmetsp:Transcript_8423/g.1149  ORF Transcript_8423/g.1149 Transcript_8423/m.1149 type:complete len:104 (-) Transcript_8423:239-550(-)